MKHCIFHTLSPTIWAGRRMPIPSKELSSPYPLSLSGPPRYRIYKHGERSYTKTRYEKILQELQEETLEMRAYYTARRRTSMYMVLGTRVRMRTTRR